MIIDLHTHTFPLSDDSQLELPELVQQAKEAGIDAICLTEHDWFRNKDTLTRLSQEHDFLILPGVELNTEVGHILVFGVEKYRFGMHRTEYLKTAVDEIGGAMIFAHPYRRNFYSHDDPQNAVEHYYHKPALRLMDAIEVLNGRGTESQNKFSQELCHRLNLKGIGASDAHYVRAIGLCYTAIDAREATVDAVREAIENGRCEARSSVPCDRLRKLLGGVPKLR